MNTGAILAFASLALLVFPASVSAGYIAWFLWPGAREFIEAALPYALAFAITALGAQFMLRAGTAVCWLTAFVGPKNLVRDHFAASARSRTALLAVVAVALTFVLIAILRYPFGDARPFLIIGATGVLIALDIATVRGVLRIARTSRSAAFFDGMTEAEKRAADRPWPVRSRPSFADPSVIESVEDARRYARRAKDSAELHTWIGAGIIVISTAFIGSSLSAMWENPGPLSTFSGYTVLGFAALGFAIQRRARSYRALENDFSTRAHVLETRLAAASQQLRQPRRTGMITRMLRRISALIRGVADAARAARSRRTPNAGAAAPRRRSA
ncbi:hypothetical protein RS85_01935 [Microbacterium sp. SA39]|nr:hypothetical protein RS85_01935 [Microbacterium sp. SA39]